jgi:methionine sulfoxide reductase heme-binding subunit
MDTHLLWWLVSRAAGVVAMVLISVAVLLGLAMSTRVLRRPGVGKVLMRLHEHLALISFAAIGVHGLALLGDPWLRPGAHGLLIPFAMTYRPAFTGMGVLAGYLAALLGLSFYARRRIGAKRWRKLHRATLAVWGLAVAHTLGAGSDAGTLWLRAVVFAPAIPIAHLTVLRVLGSRRARAAAAAAPLRATLAEERG